MTAENVCFDMLLFDKFVRMLLVVDFIAFAANTLLIYNTNNEVHKQSINFRISVTMFVNQSSVL